MVDILKLIDESSGHLSTLGYTSKKMGKENEKGKKKESSPNLFCLFWFSTKKLLYLFEPFRK